MRRRLSQFGVIVAVLVVLAAVYVYIQTDWSVRTIDVNGVTRRYLLYVPDRVEGEVPLLLAFHGFSGTAEKMRDSSQLHAMVNKHQFVLAYLDGDPTWHRSGPGTPNPDIDFVDRLCEQLENKYSIDSSRIYATGMSMGGDFVIRLGALRSDRIAAVVSQGMVTSEVVESRRPFPLMVIVGTKDNRVPESWLPRIPDAFRQRGHEVEVIRPEGVGHRWHVPLNEELWRFLSVHRHEMEPSDVASDSNDAEK